MILTLATLVLSVFGAFIRWLQTRNIIDEVSGLAKSGAGLSVVLVVYSLFVLAVVVAAAQMIRRRFRTETEATAALGSESKVPGILLIVFALVFVIAALLVMFTADAARFPMMQRIFGACGIFGGLCFPFFLAKRDGTVNPSSRTAAVILPFFYLFWMVFAYKTNADNPTLWVFAPEMLALAASTIGVYQVAAYFYGRAKPTATLIALQLAAYLNIGVLFDRRSIALTLMIAISAALMMVLYYVLVSNLKEDMD